MKLAALERWFDGRVAGPWEGKPTRGPTAAAVVLPNATLSADERVRIYTRMYFARLLEVLQADFPALEKILGEEAFERAARAYVAKHPSRSYSLNPLGRRLPEFLERAPRVPRRALAVDVARVERAMSEVFDEEEAAPLSPEAVAAVPAHAWADARLVPIPAFRLLALRTRANAAVSAARQEKRLPDLRAHATWAVVYRREYRVYRLDLTAPQFALLGALARGKTVRAALAAAAKASGPREAAALPTQLFGWFRTWTEEGLFMALHPERGAPAPSRRARIAGSPSTRRCAGAEKP